MLSLFVLFLLTSNSVPLNHGTFLDKETVWLTSRVESKYLYYLFNISENQVIHTYESDLPHLIVAESHEDFLVHTDGFIMGSDGPMELPDDFMIFSRGKSNSPGVDEVIFVHEDLVYERVRSVLGEDDDLTSYTVNVWRHDDKRLYKVNSTELLKPWPLSKVTRRSVYNICPNFHVSIEPRMAVDNFGNTHETFEVLLVSVDSFRELDSKTIDGVYLSFYASDHYIGITSWFDGEIKVHTITVSKSGEITLAPTFSMPTLGHRYCLARYEMCEDHILQIEELDRGQYEVTSIPTRGGDAPLVNARPVLSYQSSSPVFMISDDCSKVLTISNSNVHIYSRNGTRFTKVCDVPVQ